LAQITIFVITAKTDLPTPIFKGIGGFFYFPCTIFLNLPIIKGGRNSVQLMNTRFIGQRSSVAELIRLDGIKKIKLFLGGR
jgi:hypothetical protein